MLLLNSPDLNKKRGDDITIVQGAFAHLFLTRKGVPEVGIKSAKEGNLSCKFPFSEDRIPTF